MQEPVMFDDVNDMLTVRVTRGKVWVDIVMPTQHFFLDSQEEVDGFVKSLQKAAEKAFELRDKPRVST